MKNFKQAVMVILLALLFTTTHAGVISSDSVMQLQQTQFEKQQIITMLDTQAVQDKLVALGVNRNDALQRIENMTASEINALNTQLHEAPAGGILGTIVTVLVVVAVLDLMGITDVYPFINPV